MRTLPLINEIIIIIIIIVGQTVTEVDVNGTMLDVEATSCSLGDMLCSAGGCGSATANAARCCVAWGKFRELLPVLPNRNLSPRIRGKVYEACIRSAMLHGSEMWGPKEPEHYHAQGWGQFHFFNSIPILLFPIPIPIPLLTISFNSNSGDFNSNFNSNSGEFKSNPNSKNHEKWPVDVFPEIDYDYKNKVHVYKSVVIRLGVNSGVGVGVGFNSNSGVGVGIGVETSAVGVGVDILEICRSWNWSWSWNSRSWSWNWNSQELELELELKFCKVFIIIIIHLLFETYDFENRVHHTMPNNKTVCLTGITVSEVLK